MSIHVGVGGWVFEPWRGTFYPKGLPQKRELEYASTHLTGIEINGTYYGSQKPESFRKWHDETPRGFVFTVKGPRFATNRRVLAESGPSIEKFFASGVTELKEKLGAVNWQFMATKKFDAADFAAFLALLPKKVDGQAIRHAVEVRHDSFKDKAFVQMCRERGVAIVFAADSDFPIIGDVTADFIYARLMGTQEKEKLGYPKAMLATWAERAQDWAKGGEARKFAVDPAPAPRKKRDVFLFVISGAKEKNPAAAQGIIANLT
jgi:uncharacterized protein YecE (DUF72 family)